jgi:hypothetical protein
MGRGDAPPDGYTLVVTANKHTINSSPLPNAGYAIDDSAPVALFPVDGGSFTS